MKFQGVVGATLLVLATTLDDCVWLVPFVAAAAVPSSKRVVVVATLHALTFLVTLVGLAAIISIGTMLFATLMMMRHDKTGDTKLEDFDSIVLGIIGAALCWILAAYLIWKQWHKRQRDGGSSSSRSEEQQSVQTEGQRRDAKDNYGSILLQDDDHDASDSVAIASPKVGMVAMLTLLGFLDELAYFPSLILGEIFSATELCLGTLLAGCIMIAIVTLALARCQPLIDWLDRHVKLFMVVTLFAIILTIEVIFDAFH